MTFSRKYKKRFNSEILCAALWGVNLLIGTENGLMLLDRSGQGEWGGGGALPLNSKQCHTVLNTPCYFVNSTFKQRCQSQTFLIFRLRDNFETGFGS